MSQAIREFLEDVLVAVAIVVWLCLSFYGFAYL